MAVGNFRVDASRVFDTFEEFSEMQQMFQLLGVPTAELKSDKGKESKLDRLNEAMMKYLGVGKTDLESMESRISKLAQGFTQDRTRLMNTRSEKANLESFIERHSVQQLNSELSEVVGKIEAVKQEIIECRVVEFKTALDNSEGLLRSMTLPVPKAQSKKAGQKIKKQVEELQKKRGTLQKEIDQNKKALNEAERRKNEIETRRLRLDERQSEIQRTLEKIEKAPQKIEQLQTKIKELDELCSNWEKNKDVLIDMFVNRYAGSKDKDWIDNTTVIWRCFWKLCLAG